MSKLIDKACAVTLIVLISLAFWCVAIKIIMEIF